MAWTDRVREAAYTSPLGTRTILTYENVSKEVEKRTSAFEFPDADGAYIQDLGFGGQKFPLKLFFWGPDYDTAAEDFIKTLLERGPGTLEHPVYGRVLVVPFGAIKRSDRLKTEGNQAVIELTFWETIPEIYPLAQGDAASEAVAALVAFNEAAADQFAEDLNLDSPVDTSTFKARLLALKDRLTARLQFVVAAGKKIKSKVDAVKQRFDTVKEGFDTVKQRFDSINQSINASIDLLIKKPLTLATQIIALIQAPANAVTLIKQRLEGYRDLLDDILNRGAAEPSTGAEAANTFVTSDLYAAGYVSGQVASVLNHEFETKTEALEAADFILGQFAAWVEWRDSNYNSLGLIDTGGTYQALQKAVGVTAGFLVDISFTLRQERAFTLQDPRGVLDIVAELYGSVDDSLDFFIRTNALTGSEILELPAGKTIVYYV